MIETTPAVEMIEAERRRQIAQEGWSERHDDSHTNGELGQAAAAYALPHDTLTRSSVWPWRYGFKPTPDDRERELVKAGALIVAEIERLQRKAERD